MNQDETPVQMIHRLMTVAKLLAKVAQETKSGQPKTAD